MQLGLLLLLSEIDFCGKDGFVLRESRPGAFHLQVRHCFVSEELVFANRFLVNKIEADQRLGMSE